MADPTPTYGSGVDFNRLVDLLGAANLETFTIRSATSREIVLANPDGYALTITGRNLSILDIAQGFDLSGARVTGMTVALNDQTLFFFSGVSITASSFDVALSQGGRAIVDLLLQGNDRSAGSTLDDVLFGGRGNDSIDGGSGNDTLSGDAGNDRISGGTNDDVVSGGRGKDVLSGGAGEDTFVFADSVTRRDMDRISDFAVNDDRLMMVIPGATPLSSDQIVFGTAALDGDDRVIYNPATGVLMFDADGNGAGRAIKIAVLTDAPTLLIDNFVTTDIV